MKLKALRLTAWLCIAALCAVLHCHVTAEETGYRYECVILMAAGDENGNVVNAVPAIQVRAGDGSGDTWAVCGYGITEGAAMYAAAGMSDAGGTKRAELICGDRELGIAVFCLDEAVDGSPVLTMTDLSDMRYGDEVTISGIRSEGEALYFFTVSAVLDGLDEDSGRFLTLSRENREVEALGILPVAAVQDMDGNLIGIYVDDNKTLPAAYLMEGQNIAAAPGERETEEPPQQTEPQAEEEEPDDSEDDSGDSPAGQDPEDSGNIPEEPGEGKESVNAGLYSETVEIRDEIDNLLAQADAERSRMNTIRMILIGASAAAAVMILCAAFYGRKRRMRAEGLASGREEARRKETGSDAPGISELWLEPLPGTPGERRRIPAEGLTFGRAGENSVRFDVGTQGVSARHCSLTWQNGRLLLTDLGSTYGTFPEGGSRLDRGNAVWLKEGSCFYLGSKKIGFRITGAAD